jgi:hypothetical protein
VPPFEFRNRVGNGIVQAPVQHAELLNSKRRIPLYREIRNALTEVAVVMNT